MKQFSWIFVVATLFVVSCDQSSKNRDSERVSALQETNASEVSASQEQYIDLALPGPGGNVVKVSDYVSQNMLTLIDFWASWCGPCRAEMPYVVRTYQAFHDKGFEIVGVSFDNNRETWLAAISQLQMAWPQMSDLKGWESEGARVYHVQAIPSNVLIDRQGYIVARDLRGDELYEFVMSALQK